MLICQVLFPPETTTQAIFMYPFGKSHYSFVWTARSVNEGKDSNGLIGLNHGGHDRRPERLYFRRQTVCLRDWTRHQRGLSVQNRVKRRDHGSEPGECRGWIKPGIGGVATGG